MSLYVRFRMWRHGMSQWSPEYVASRDWLSTPQHKRWAWDVKEAGGCYCVMCGRSAHDRNEDGSRVVLNSDHIRPRKTHPWLALKVSNGQILCDYDNAGKGNCSERDWRHEGHPHRRKRGILD